MTQQPYEGATPDQLRHPMVRELLGIHDMFRGEMKRMLGYIDELISGDQPLTEQEINARVGALVRAGIRYAQTLHHHHHLETAVLFPAVRQEEPEMAAVIDRLNSDHDEIAVLIDRFDAGIRDFAKIEPAVIDTDLRRLAEALQAHLAYEETHVCPVIARFSGWMI